VSLGHSLASIKECIHTSQRHSAGPRLLSQAHGRALATLTVREPVMAGGSGPFRRALRTAWLSVGRPCIWTRTGELRVNAFLAVIVQYGLQSMSPERAETLRGLRNNGTAPKGSACELHRSLLETTYAGADYFATGKDDGCIRQVPFQLTPLFCRALQ
jgi:hypothetical protein